MELSKIKPFSFTFNDSTAVRIHELISEVLIRRCTCIVIVRDINSIEVQTSQIAYPFNHDSPLVELETRDLGPTVIRWSIGGYHTWIDIDKDNPCRVTWSGRHVTIRKNAPAGHPLVWIYALEAPFEEVRHG